MAKTLTVKEKVELVEKLNKDIKNASLTLNDNEARYLVDMYYTVQNYRIASQAQIRSINQAADENGTEAEPHEVLALFLGNFEQTEKNIVKVLECFVKSKPIGRWLLDITGIGPVIAAGLIAHIDISKVQTAGQIWAFAGLDPTKEWKKGQVRPWNAKLKVVCWKAGQSFIKVSSNDKDIYGHIYKEKKDFYNKKNEEGGFAERAAEILKSKKFGKETEAYKAYSEGKLPKGHIDSMAQRFAVKIFLSHLFTVWYKMYHGEMPPKPFAISILGHAHEIKPPAIDDLQKYMD